MKTKKQIEEYLNNLRKMLDDALKNPDSDYDADAIQQSISELKWVLEK